MLLLVYVIRLTQMFIGFQANIGLLIELQSCVSAIMKKFVVQPELSTDKGYLHHTLKYAINRGVTEQWIMARIRGFPSHEGTEGEFAFELNGRRSLSEKEFRTLEPQSP